MIKYLTFGFAISFISWIVGMIVNAALIKTPYYNQKLSNFNFLSNENLNKYIGIEIFKWLIIHSIFKYFNPKLSLKKKINVSELADLRNEMTIAEMGHLIGFCFVTVFVLVKLINGNYLFAFIILIVNILMNLYPSLLQQQNKRRIDQYTKIIALRAANHDLVST
jgi:hypothetical protein